MAKITKKIQASFARLVRDERGTQLVETAVWIGLITAAVVATVSTIGTEVGNSLTRVSDALVKYVN